MKTLIIITLSLLMSIAAIAQTFITQVKPYGEKTWGYINLDGEMIIAPIYKKCYEFAENGADALEIIEELYSTLRIWITAQAISIAYTMVLVWVVLGWVLGMPNAFPVALVAGATTFIPNIGLFIPLIPIVVFTASDDISKLGIVVIAYILIQFSESNIFTPYVVKANLKIPAGAMLLFQIMATTLFGAVGLLLAVPLLAILITLVREIYSYDMLGLREKVVLVEENAGKIKSAPVPLEESGATLPEPT